MASNVSFAEFWVKLSACILLSGSILFLTFHYIIDCIYKEERPDVAFMQDQSPLVRQASYFIVYLGLSICSGGALYPFLRLPFGSEEALILAAAGGFILAITLNEVLKKVSTDLTELAELRTERERRDQAARPQTQAPPSHTEMIDTGAAIFSE